MRAFKFLSRPLDTILILVVILVLGPTCKPKEIKLKSPPHYNFAAGHEYKLDPVIREISGIVWDTRSDVFISHNDESGKLFYLDKATVIIKNKVEFGLGKADYEDIALFNWEVYLLVSDGTITKVVTDSTAPNKMIGTEVGKLDLDGTNDFESMYYDSARHALVVLCKNCDMDKGKNRVSAFAFYPDSVGFVKEPIYSIDMSAVEKLAPKKSTKLEPSAAAVHPVLKKLFIVSSGSHQLVITDLDGKPEMVFVLSNKMFPQPEGITFKSQGDMYISNEAVSSRATLMRFGYTK